MNETEQEDHPQYQITTVYDDVAGKITSTVVFHNPQGNVAQKANMISHQVMDLKEKGITQALRKMGWVSPSEFKALAQQFEEELQRAKKT